MTPSSGPIVPRWEWRTFGTRFGKAEAAFAALEPQEVQESDELYFLSQGSTNVKVRDDLLDIKVLEEVDADGLERWMPTLKAEFPLTAATVQELLNMMGISDVGLDRDSYTLNQLIDDLVAATTVRTMAVHKRRVRYSFGGCTAEVSDIDVDGHLARTIAIESENPDAVVAAVREVGLEGYVNTNYQEGLTWAVDGAPECYAVIDVGTNSVKLHIGEWRNGTWSAVVDRAELTRLGEGLDEHGSIGMDALERTVSAISDMIDEAKRVGVLAIAAVGTAGLRMARNRQEFIDTVHARTEITVEVISGEEESRLAFVATQASLGLDVGSFVVFETGGGSSQFTFGRDEKVDERFSVDVGVVRYTELFELGGVVTSKTLSNAMAAITSDLAAIDDRDPPDILVGMGGSITNITAVALGLEVYDPEVVHGTVLEKAEIHRQIELYRSQDAESRRSIVGLQPNRADLILAGACIVLVVMDKLDQATLTISDRGLRHGVIAERFGE